MPTSLTATTIPQAVLNGVAHLAPVSWPVGARRVNVTVILTGAAAGQLTMAIEVTFDGGVTWREVVEDIDVLGRTDKNGQPAVASVNHSTNRAPTHSRVRYEMLNPLNIGALVEHS